MTGEKSREGGRKRKRKEHVGKERGVVGKRQGKARVRVRGGRGENKQGRDKAHEGGQGEGGEERVSRKGAEGKAEERRGIYLKSMYPACYWPRIK